MEFGYVILICLLICVGWGVLRYHQNTRVIPARTLINDAKELISLLKEGVPAYEMQDLAIHIYLCLDALIKQGMETAETAEDMQEIEEYREMIELLKSKFNIMSSIEFMEKYRKESPCTD